MADGGRAGDGTLRSWLDVTGPDHSEQARTTIAGASSLRLGVSGGGSGGGSGGSDVGGGSGGGVEVARHVVAVDGSVVMVLDETSPVIEHLLSGRRKALPVQIKAVDVAPVALPERVRSTVVAAGRLTLLTDQLPGEVHEHMCGPDGVFADRAMLRFLPRRVVLETTTPRGPSPSVEIALDDYREARTDPLIGIEADWLQHLDRDHPDVLRALGRAGSGETVRPYRLDRHGMVLRVASAAGAWHLRLPFDAPVACGCDLVEAVDVLVRRADPGFGPWCG